MIYTSEELTSLITRAESYFQRLTNEDLGNLLKGMKPINSDLIECLWLYKEALLYCNELGLYNNVQTTKIYKKLLNLVAGNDVDIEYNTNGIISVSTITYYLAGETPIATNLEYGKVKLSHPSNDFYEAVVISETDPRIYTWENAADKTVENLSFNPATGDLTIERTVSPDLVENLDGRYLVLSTLNALVAAAFKIDYSNSIVGDLNGINTIFTTSNSFIAGTTRVYLNGLRLTNNGSNDYTEISNNQISFVSPPDAGDLMIIEYIKQ